MALITIHPTEIDEDVARAVATIRTGVSSA
jgi:hypothetical protein